MKQAEVSILIPVYNREKFIGECIQSALDQTFTDFEIVVVDNASTDRTWAICQGYAAKDERVRIFRNESNVGPVRNWLACLNRAKGMYGKILFSDDLMHFDCLKLTLPMFCDDVGFVFSQVMLGEVAWQGEAECCWQGVSGVYDAKSFIKASMYGGRSVPVSPCAAVFRLKDIVRALETEISIPKVNDFLAHGAGPDLFVYLLTAVQYEKVAYRQEKLVFFRDHPHSISASESHTVPVRYAQTRIFFAGEYLADYQFQRVSMLEWLNAMKRQRKFTAFSRFIRSCCHEGHRPVFSLAVLVWALIRFAVNIVRGRWNHEF